MASPKRKASSKERVLLQPPPAVDDDGSLALREKASTAPGRAEKSALELRRGFLPLSVDPPSTKRQKVRKLESADATKDGSAESKAQTSGVLYIGRIPYGFFETQMRGFFGQFGTIKRLRLSRNKKTGKSKKFAFLEFESPEVAPIVAECMHNYLLFESLLQVRVVPPSLIHPKLWVGANRNFRVRPRHKLERERVNKNLTAVEQIASVKRQIKQFKSKEKKWKELGYDYSFVDSGLMPVLPSVPTHFKFSDDSLDGDSSASVPAVDETVAQKRREETRHGESGGEGEERERKEEWSLEKEAEEEKNEVEERGVEREKGELLEGVEDDGEKAFVEMEPKGRKRVGAGEQGKKVLREKVAKGARGKVESARKSTQVEGSSPAVSKSVIKASARSPIFLRSRVKKKPQAE